MVQNREHILQLADTCVVLSAKIDDTGAAAELLRISRRLLELADPTLSAEEDSIPEFNRRQMFGAH
jgi:hypothetical protein